MAEILKEQEQKQNEQRVYFTQKELAQRWRVSEATVKNIRDNGGISYFYPPNSSRVLYLRDEVVGIEQDPTNLTSKEGYTLKKQTEFKMKKPVVSSNSKEKWEI